MGWWWHDGMMAHCYCESKCHFIIGRIQMNTTEYRERHIISYHIIHTYNDISYKYGMRNGEFMGLDS